MEYRSSPAPANPPEAVRSEIEAFLLRDDSRLGDVFVLQREGLDAHEIAEELGVGTSGFVSNYRQIADILLGLTFTTRPARAESRHGHQWPDQARGVVA